MSGNTHTSNCACYGYIKNLGKWIIDEEAASVVCGIFQMCMDGKGLYEIARCLAERKVEQPSYYLAKKGWKTISQIAIITMPILCKGIPLPRY